MRWVAGLILVVVAAAAGFFWYASPSTYPEEYILTADTILTMDPDKPVVQAVLVKKDRIVATGSLEQMQRLSAVETVHLNGVLIPGLIEPYTYPIASALLEHAINASDEKYSSRYDVIVALEDAASPANLSPWVLVYGWDRRVRPDLSAPTLAELNAISPNKPLVILNQTMTEGFANRSALDLAGLNGAHGAKLNGQDEINRVIMAMPSASPEAVELLVRKQYRDYAKAGYTTIGASGSITPAQDPVGLLQKIALGGQAPVRTYLYLLEDQVPHWQLGGTADFNILGAKYWISGEPEADGLMLHESLMAGDAIGGPVPADAMQRMAEDELLSKVRAIHRRSGQVALQVKDSASIDRALDAIEAVQKEDPRPRIRHRIDFATVVREDQLQRAADLNVVLGFFMDHLTHYGADSQLTLTTQELSNYLPAKTATEKGGVVAFHGDHPAVPLNPFATIQSAVSRTTPDGRNILNHAEAISPENALKAMTLNAAIQLGQQEEIGSVEPGKKADFTLLNLDPLVVKPEGLHMLKVLLTIRDGQPVDTRWVSWFSFRLALLDQWHKWFGDV